jgi:polyisoprenoid-binding protein YceI
VLKRQEIVFHSTRVRSAAGGGVLAVEGELALAGSRGPVAFDLALGDDGELSATAIVTQSRWGVKPYSALFGALKVLDDVEVVLDGHL